MKFKGLTFIIFTLIIYTIMGFTNIAGAAPETLNLDLPEPQAAPMPSMFSLFLRLFVSLIVIGGLLLLTMKFLRKNMRSLTKASNIQILDQFAFSINKGIYIVQIAGKIYVLGVTDHNINLVTEINDKETIEEIVLHAAKQADQNSRQSQVKPFRAHIQKQIQKLQQLSDIKKDKFREDDSDD